MIRILGTILPGPWLAWQLLEHPVSAASLKAKHRQAALPLPQLRTNINVVGKYPASKLDRAARPLPDLPGENQLALPAGRTVSWGVVVVDSMAYDLDFLTSLPARVLHLQLWGLGEMLFFWILIALAVLDAGTVAAQFLTWPAMGTGVILNFSKLIVLSDLQKSTELPITNVIGNIGPASLKEAFLAPFAAAGIILLI